MKTVWCVFTVDDEFLGDLLMGIFSTKESAKKYVEESLHDRPGCEDEWWIDEWTLHE